jgi:mono/diheme cytochrome c family protein
MNCSGVFPLRCALLGLAGVLALCGTCGFSSDHGSWNAGPTSAKPQAISPLSADDVSILFPPPTQAADFANLIAVNDLTTPDPADSTKRDPVWSDAVFQQFVGLAASQFAQVTEANARIELPAEARMKANWFVAGIRIDAGAPGLSDATQQQFGRSPEIRLIVQPVTRNADGSPKVDDIAGHLIFDFSTKKQRQDGCLASFVPDLEAYNAIVADVAAIRTKLAEGQMGTDKVSTAGVPLGVHPGLVDPTTAANFRSEIVAFLEKHLSDKLLDGMAIAGLPASGGNPWIFLSMALVPPGTLGAPPNGGFVPVPSPALDGPKFALALLKGGSVPRVVPTPHTNNLNPVTCRNNAAQPAGLPVEQRKGVATTDLFVNPAPTAAQTEAIADVVADPAKSNFFNTDCASCHTETRRTMDIPGTAPITGIDSRALPNGAWDVRNFGWGDTGKPAFQATVTRRTANETAAVVAFINSDLLAKQQH